MPSPVVTIPTPCFQPWAAMTSTAAGRHCAVCAKTVTDFSHKTDAEILAFFKTKGSSTVCGRFLPGQLDRPLVPAPPAVGSSWRAWLAATIAVWGWRELTAPPVRAQVPTEQYQPTPPAYLSPGATQLRLRGVVVDSTGESLPGVTLLLEGTTIGTSTDAHGRFDFLFPTALWENGKTTALFSYVGYHSVKLPLISKPSAEGEPVRIVLSVNTTAAGTPIIYTAGGAFYRKPWPWHPQRFWFWLTRPFHK